MKESKIKLEEFKQSELEVSQLLATKGGYLSLPTTSSILITRSSGTDMDSSSTDTDDY